MTPIARRSRRRGLTIIPALVTLVLVTLFCGVLMRQTVDRRAAGRSEERRMQAEWLAESALARASARLAADPGYNGETWEIPAADLQGDAGVVRIAVEKADDPKPNSRPRRRVRVEADYPRGEGLRARVSKSLTLTLEPGTSGGPS